MLLLSKADMVQIFTIEEAIEADKEAFQMYSQGACTVPLRTGISAPEAGGTFLFMPAYAKTVSAVSVKTISLFPANAAKNLPTAPAQIMLLDGESGQFLALLEGDFVTQMRTGAASGVAFELFGRKLGKKGALIGAGSQGTAQLSAMLAACPLLEEVAVYARNRERLEQFVLEMGQLFKDRKVKIASAVSADEAVSEADYIITATPAEAPLFDGSNVKKGAVISAVGSYQHHMQELDPYLLQRASKIYFDAEAAVLEESGDVRIPLAQGLISKADFTGEIGQVLLGQIPAREAEDEIIVFKSVGTAVQDLVTAKRIYDKAVSRQVGTTWPAG